MRAWALLTSSFKQAVELALILFRAGRAARTAGFVLSVLSVMSFVLVFHHLLHRFLIPVMAKAAHVTAHMTHHAAHVTATVPSIAVFSVFVPLKNQKKLKEPDKHYKKIFPLF